MSRMTDAGVLFAAHRDRVFRYLSRIVGHGEAARDLTQEVFLRAARGPVPESDDAGRRAWIFRIARNLALNHVRDGRRHATSAEPYEASHRATQELSAALAEAMAALPDLDRDVFLLRETAGLSYDEIAHACELTPAAVRSRLHRARQQLRAALAPALCAEQARTGVRLGHEWLPPRR
jgi:RNA polymerase sigma-70 factor, ECF subfamily